MCGWWAVVYWPCEWSISASVSCVIKALVAVSLFVICVQRVVATLLSWPFFVHFVIVTINTSLNFSPDVFTFT